MVSMNLFIVGVLACGLGSMATLIFGSPVDKKIQCVDPSSYRLPDYVVPDSYELWILSELGAGNFAYEGRVIIDLCILKETDSLIVHVKDLDIHREKSKVLAITHDNNAEVPISGQQQDTKRQFYILTFATVLPPGNYSLSLTFTGEVNDFMLGFYRSSHKVDGRTRWLGFTQFSSVFARSAFPCLDEPYLKATYRIHLGHYANETATGNTVAEKTEEIKPGYLLTTLAKTPRISTYLVGWAFHDFEYTNATTSTTSMTFGLWARGNMKALTSQALKEGSKIYDALTKWINVDNPIEKMEQIAVPDFFFSAMENWGMVTFRERAVLWDNGLTPTSVIHSGLNTMAHEYAHTWFGNLVTPKFWDVMWLKEGFATFFGHYAQHLISNDSNLMDLFAVEVLHPALLDDSTQHNRTMNGRNIGSPESARAGMDFVTYKKGASIIRMVQHIIGDWAFHRGLHSYVDELKYSHATPQDFYRHLQNASDQSNVLQKPIQVSDVIETWANQPGYPMVTVVRNYTTNLTEISQEKFRLNQNSDHHQWDNSRWWIPVNFAAAESAAARSGTSPTISWIRPQDKSILIFTDEAMHTLLCNINQAYYYRVNYDETNWQRLMAHLKSDSFDTIGEPNRAALIDDSFNLARAGYINYTVPLNLSRYLTQEKDYGPWLAATNSFTFLNIMLSGRPDVYREFQAFVNHLTEPIYKYLTTQEASSERLRSKLLRGLIIWTVCSVNNVDCINSANLGFKDWLADTNKTINPDVKRTFYCTGIRLSGEEDWRKVLRIFLETELHTEQELLIAGLGCTKNSALIKEFLNYFFYDGPEVRKQYKLLILTAVLEGNPESVEYVLDFVAENLKRINDMGDSTTLTEVFGCISKRIVHEEQLQKLKVTIDSNIELLGSSVQGARKAIEIANENIAWINRYVPIIAQSLREANFSSVF